MNTLLWVAQGLLALLFSSTGTMLLVTPRGRIAERTTWAEAFSTGFVKLVGLLEVLGATGLVAPLATGVWPQLTSLAAGGLGLLMIGAVATHLRYREYLKRAPAAGRVAARQLHHLRACSGCLHVVNANDSEASACSWQARSRTGPTNA